MVKKNLASSLSVIAVICLALALSCSNAFAGDRDRGRDGGHDAGRDRGRSRGHEVVVVGHDRYRYHDGRFFSLGLFGIQFALSRPPLGAVVTILPAGHRTVIRGNAAYYYYDGIYYRDSAAGYVVVPEPAVVKEVVYVPVANTLSQTYTAPQVSNAAMVTINVPNSNGSFTPVTLVKRDGGYIGPQGEYYPDRPTVNQLSVLYGI